MISYPTPYLGTASTIEEIATRLLQQFDDRGFFDRFKEIYIIAHSMGGLIAKRLLIDLGAETRAEKLRLVRAVLFLSTPAQGSRLARFVAWVTCNPQFADLRSAVSNTYLQSLDNQWETLLRDRDAEHATFPRSFCAYEVRRTLGLARIVDRVYAKTRADENPYPMEFTHGDIAKPYSREGDPYEWAKAKILTTAERDRGRPLPKADPSQFSIGVARLLNDTQRNLEQLIVEALDDFEGVQVLRFDRKIDFDVTSPESIERAHARARTYLVETSAHVLVWGNVLNLQGKVIPKLYWTISQSNGSRQKGTKYSPTDDLSLPGVFWNDLRELLHLLVISEYARFEQQEGHYLADKIKPFLDRVRSLIERRPTQPTWTAKAVAEAQVLFASAAITYGDQAGDSESLETAVQVLHEALKEHTRERVPLEWARTQHNFGTALRTLGERESGTARLEEAIAAFRDALKERTRERVPLQWALTQHNLGTALWTLGERESGTARLEEAVAAYRDALAEPEGNINLSMAIERDLSQALATLSERTKR